MRQSKNERVARVKIARNRRPGRTGTIAKWKNSRVTATTNPTKIARNKKHSQVLNVKNQMGNRPGRTRTIGVDRPGNQICHILIKIQSLSSKKKKRFNLYLKKLKIKVQIDSNLHPAIKTII